MGYYATCNSGELFPKDASSAEKILCILEEEGIEASMNGASIRISGGYDKYHSESFEEIAPLCKEGYLDFLGEDDAVWSLVFSEGKMQEIPGEIVWNHELPGSQTVCCFCGKSIEGHGNNPAPASMHEDDVCCDACNLGIVLPARIAQMSGKSGKKLNLDCCCMPPAEDADAKGGEVNA